MEYESGKYVAVGDGDLVVRELQWSDMGMHKCVARSEFGEDMKEAFVYPLAPPPTSNKVICKHWKITQGRLCCGCWTADSQANVGRHQLFSNKKRPNLCKFPLPGDKKWMSQIQRRASF